MAFLVRKINKAKWKKSIHDQNIDNLSADAITVCLKTSGDTLSCWLIPDLEKKSIDDAALAIVASHDNLDAIDIAIIDDSFPVNSGILLLETPGKTKVEELAKTHRDLSDLNYKKLGLVAQEILKQFREDQESERIIRIERGKLKELLKNAINQKRLDKDSLPDKIKNKL